MYAIINNNYLMYIRKIFYHPQKNKNIFVISNGSRKTDTAQKMRFSLRISSVHVTKSTGNIFANVVTQYVWNNAELFFPNYLNILNIS